MARITGSLVVTARDGSGWGSAWGAPAAGGAAENAERETRKAEQARPALARLFRVPTSAFRVSQHPVHEGPQKHDNADQPVGAEKRRIEPRQVTRLDELVLPGDQDSAERDAAEVGDAEVGAEPEQDQRREREAVQQLGEQDGARLAEPHHQRGEPLGAVERLVLERVEHVEPAYPERHRQRARGQQPPRLAPPPRDREIPRGRGEDRKSTRLNSSHVEISYAVFCLKKKKKKTHKTLKEKDHKEREDRE